MDYTTLPRNLLYREALTLDDWDVDNADDINGMIYDKLLEMDCLSPGYKETESQLLSIFNDIYYILTIASLEKRPYLKLGFFREISRIWSGYGYRPEREVIVLSAVGCILTAIDDANLTKGEIRLREEIYKYLAQEKSLEQYIVKIEALPHLKWMPDGRGCAFLIPPAELTPDLLRGIDWNFATQGFFPPRIREVVFDVGRCDTEMMLILEAIRNSMLKTVFSGDLDQEKTKMQADTEKMFSDLAKEINGGIPYALQDDPQKRIEELLNENKSLKNRVSMLEEKIAAKEARLFSGFDDVYIIEEYDFDGDERKNVKRKIIDTDKAKALAAAQKDNKEYQKQLAEMEKTVNTLRDKLGNHSVFLSVLASGIKDFAEEKNIEEAHTLFEHLCYILMHVPAWTKNAPELKKFFKKARKETQKASLPPIDNHGQVVIQTGKEAEASFNPKKDETE